MQRDKIFALAAADTCQDIDVVVDEFARSRDDAIARRFSYGFGYFFVFLDDIIGKITVRIKIADLRNGLRTHLMAAKRV